MRDHPVQSDEAPPPAAVENRPLVHAAGEARARPVEPVLRRPGRRPRRRRRPGSPAQARPRRRLPPRPAPRGPARAGRCRTEGLVGVELQHPGAAREVLEGVALRGEIALEGPGGDTDPAVGNPATGTARGAAAGPSRRTTTSSVQPACPGSDARTASRSAARQRTPRETGMPARPPRARRVRPAPRPGVGVQQRRAARAVERAGAAAEAGRGACAACRCRGRRARPGRGRRPARPAAAASASQHAAASASPASEQEPAGAAGAREGARAAVGIGQGPVARAEHGGARRAKQRRRILGPRARPVPAAALVAPGREPGLRRLLAILASECNSDRVPPAPSVAGPRALSGGRHRRQRARDRQAAVPDRRGRLRRALQQRAGLRRAAGARVTHLALVNRGGQMREWLADPPLPRPPGRSRRRRPSSCPSRCSRRRRTVPEPTCWTREALARLAPLGRRSTSCRRPCTSGRALLGARTHRPPEPEHRLPRDARAPPRRGPRRPGAGRCLRLRLRRLARAIPGRPSAPGSRPPRRRAGSACTGRTDEAHGMTTLVTVLKSGGRYDATWVERLARGVRRHAPGLRPDPLPHGPSARRARRRAGRPAPWLAGVVGEDGGVPARPERGHDAAVRPRHGLRPARPTPWPSRASPRWRTTSTRAGSPARCCAGRATPSPSLYDAFAAEPERWMTPGSCGPVPNAVHGDQVVHRPPAAPGGRRPGLHPAAPSRPARFLRSAAAHATGRS